MVQEGYQWNLMSIFVGLLLFNSYMNYGSNEKTDDSFQRNEDKG